jgi:hypothetical protein
MNPNRGNPAIFLLAIVCFPVAWSIGADGAWKKHSSLKAIALAAQVALLVGGALTLGVTIPNYLLMNLLLFGTVALSGVWGLVVRLVDVPSSYAHVFNVLSMLLCILFLINVSDSTIRNFTLVRAMPIIIGLAIYLFLTAFLIVAKILPDMTILSFGDTTFSVNSVTSKKYLASIGALIVVLAL